MKCTLTLLEPKVYSKPYYQNDVSTSVDAAAHVSQGSLNALFNTTEHAAVSHPVLQCLHIRLLGNEKPSTCRYRAVFGDVLNYVQTALVGSKCFVCRH